MIAHAEPKTDRSTGQTATDPADGQPPGADTANTTVDGQGRGSGPREQAAAGDVPLWRQVLDDLEHRLAVGDIAGRFPTDRELVEHYDVSRHTVREAVDRLKARGVVERARGRGSSVVRPQLLQAAGTVYSLFRAVESTGAVQASDVLRLEPTTAPDVATRLGLDPDDELVVLERLRRVDGDPLALDTVWLPGPVGRAVLDVDFSRTALYDELERAIGVAPNAGHEVISAVVGDRRLRTVLALDDDEAVQRIERTSRHGQRLLEHRVTLIRGHHFALVSHWPDSTAPTVEVSTTSDQATWTP